MKKWLLRSLSAAVILGITIGMTACTKPDGDSGSASQSDSSAVNSGSNLYKDTVTLDVYTMTGNFQGEQIGWFAKVIKDKFNLKLNIISAQTDGNADQSFQTRSASGDLGDIVVYGAMDTKFTDSLKANLLMKLSENDLLNKHGQNIVKNYSGAIKRIADKYGDYAIPNNVSNESPNTPSEDSDLIYGVYTRYDYYQEIGSPKLNSFDDVYPMLKSMAQKHPTNANGQKQYAFSLFKDWDGCMMMFGKMIAQLYGYEEAPFGGFLLTNNMATKYQSIIDPDGYYVKALKVYNQAYRDGLLDPDSISQTWDDITKKYSNSQVLYSQFSWLGPNYFNTPESISKGSGFAFVPISDEKIWSNGFTPNGSTYLVALGKSCKNPERAMDFLNWYYSPEGGMAMKNGPEGLAWEMKDGKPVLTDFGKKALPANAIEVPSEYGGSDWQTGDCKIGFDGIAANAINPNTKEPYYYKLWSSTLTSSASTLQKNWNAAMDNALDVKDWLVKNNHVSVSPGTDYVAPTLPTDIQSTQDVVKMDIRDYSWKMVYAKNESEFNSLLKQMTEKVKSEGYDKVVDWDKQQLTELASVREKAAKSGK
ncbi:MAG TPA: ABC transporter substrate-binding protein [Ruminiclostridium sp.]|nr:ABC transporter substrate-binding protein [Ruminiclostridium sp.]